MPSRIEESINDNDGGDDDDQSDKEDILLTGPR